MIINPMKCKQCNEELQVKDVGVGINAFGNLVRVCLFCGLEEEVEGAKKHK